MQPVSWLLTLALSAVSSCGIFVPLANNAKVLDDLQHGQSPEQVRLIAGKPDAVEGLDSGDLLWQYNLFVNPGKMSSVFACGACITMGSGSRPLMSSCSSSDPGPWRNGATHGI